MGMLRLRPLWFLLLAVLWMAIGFVLTPSFDNIAEAIGAEGDGFMDAILGAVPWILYGAIAFGLSLWWIYAMPAWHPWRDAIFATIFWGAATIGLFLVVNTVDLYEMFSYWSHESVDLGGDPNMYVVLPVIVVPTYLVAAVFVGLGAANRIWATPIPKKEAVFGERPTPE